MTREQFEYEIDAFLMERRRDFDRLLQEARAKLLRGWDQWKDTNAGNMSVSQIWGEIADEAVDVFGWAFWVWLKAKQGQGQPAQQTAPLHPFRP